MDVSGVSAGNGPRGATPLRVLVVGSAGDVPGGIEPWLAARGGVPRFCADARSARAVASLEVFALVIVDALDVDLDQLFGDLRACGQPGTLVCLGRGHDRSEEARALRAGADLFVPRPLQAEHIDLAVTRSQPVLDRPLPLFGPLSVIPARRVVVAPGVSSSLTEAEYQLLLLVAEAPQAWCGLDAAGAWFHWRVSEGAVAARLKDLVRRVRLRMGPYGAWIAFSRRRGVCLRESW